MKHTPEILVGNILEDKQSNLNINDQLTAEMSVVQVKNPVFRLLFNFIIIYI